MRAAFWYAAILKWTEPYQNASLPRMVLTMLRCLHSGMPPTIPGWGHSGMGVGILRWVRHPEMGSGILECLHPEMGAGILRCRHPGMGAGILRWVRHPRMPTPISEWRHSRMPPWHSRMRLSGRTSIRLQNSTPITGRAVTKRNRCF